MKKISGIQVRADFNHLTAVVHYTRAAHKLGLWKSERILIQKYFPDLSAPLIEAGCGAGRATVALWELGYRQLAGFDFADELVDQAISLAAERNAGDIRYFVADATRLTNSRAYRQNFRPRHRFAGALFLFNGLMQIPGRENRRKALRELQRVCRRGAPLLFTTHDRNSSPTEKALWRLEAQRWARGKQDPRLVEFGDRYFKDEALDTFMHLPDRQEIIEDLALTGWKHTFDTMRYTVARENDAVRDFSDECRFWVAHRQ